MYLKDESATVLIATQLAQRLTKSITQSTMQSTMQSNFTLYLTGDLGAGKTSFARGFLRGLGYSGRVKSPTFTVVEPYQLNEMTVYHLDLYRLAHPEELEYLGLRDFFDSNVILLIEWPERGSEYLPNADIKILLQHCQDPQQDGRQLHIEAASEVGQAVLTDVLG